MLVRCSVHFLQPGGTLTARDCGSACMYPVRWEAVPSAENPGVSHAAEKLRAIAERAPEIENDLRQVADDLDARMRQPTGYRERPARAAARQRLTRLLPVLKFGRVHRFWR